MELICYYQLGRNSESISLDTTIGFRLLLLLSQLSCSKAVELPPALGGMHTCYTQRGASSNTGQ